MAATLRAAVGAIRSHARHRSLHLRYPFSHSPRHALVATVSCMNHGGCSADCSVGLLIGIARRLIGIAQSGAQVVRSGGVLKAAEAGAKAAFAGLGVGLICAAKAGLRLGTRMMECADVLVCSGCGMWWGVRGVAWRRVGSHPAIFVHSHSRARVAGQCVQFWPEMVCMTMTAWLGSHVPSVAGARF